MQLRLYGDEIETLRELAAQVKARMRAILGTTDVHDDWGDPVFQMTLKVDNDRAALSGLTNQDIDLGPPGFAHFRQVLDLLVTSGRMSETATETITLD